MTAGPRLDASRRPVSALLAPLGAYMVLTSLEGFLPTSEDGTVEPTAYVIAYSVKILLVAIVAWYCRGGARDYLAVAKPMGRPMRIGLAVASLALGVGIGWAWIASDPYYPRIPFLGERTPFRPETLDANVRILFFLVRGFGLILLVPRIEELVWRDLVVRLVADPDDIRKVPVGKVTPVAAIVSAILFTMVHPEWLPALVTGLAWAMLVGASGRLWPALLSHAAANATLGAIVLATDQWQYL